MSWNGTVRCSHCYVEGHNRASCPALKERMEERLVDNPDDWRAKEYFEKKSRRSVRTCGYCKRAGHNRKTCHEAKEDKQRFIEKNIKLRGEALNWLKEVGLGIGTLVKYSYWSRKDYETQHVLGLVKNIRWDNVKINSTSTNTFPNSDLSFLECVPVHSMDAADVSTHYTSALEIVSTIPDRLIAAQVPCGWLASTDEATLRGIEGTLKEDDMEFVRRQVLDVGGGYF